MPVNDWSRVGAGIFHHFHHSWIEELQRSLNRDILGDDFYALAEQHAAGYGPDVLTLQTRPAGSDSVDHPSPPTERGTGVSLAPPPIQLTGETEIEFYRRKQNSVVVRHVSGDRIVAMIEVLSPGNKSGRHGIDAFVRKTAELLDAGIHLLLVDVHPPGPRDPAGIHGVIWEEITGESYALPVDRPLTLAAYENDTSVRAYVEHISVGTSLVDMPLFLYPRAHVLVPLEATYEAAWDAFPSRWRTVLE